MKKQKLPSQTCNHNNWFYLLIASIKENLTQGFLLETKQDLLSNKANANNLFIAHLENLLAKHPNSGLVKLYLAFYYAKKPSLTPKPLHLSMKLNKHPNSSSRSMHLFFYLKLKKSSNQTLLEIHLELTYIHTFNTKSIPRIFKKQSSNKLTGNLQCVKNCLTIAPTSIKFSI